MNRRAIALLSAGCLLAAGSPQSAPWPTAGWAVSTAAEQGLDPAPLLRFERRARQGDFGNIDRLLIVRNGYVIANERYEVDYEEASRGKRGALGCGVDACEDPAEVQQYNYYHPTFHPYHRGRDVHTLQSVTKSVAATVIGAAIHAGYIPGTEAGLLSFLADYDLSRVDPRLHDATLEDLLTMRSGIEWHEQDRPFDSTNTTLQLEASQDWVQFTLDQPMDADPGAKWVYNSGGSHLMSAVVRDATGRTIDIFAEEHLFGPLGITDYHWKLTPRGLPDTEGGLYLEAESLAKIGYLYLHDGVWDGRRILPEGWVNTATARHVESTNGGSTGYGYQWWRPDRSGTTVWAGMGFGGQYLLVFPEHDVVAVLNSWNVFGERLPSSLGALLTAIVQSVGG